jgi:hypothetical protein
MKAFLKSLLNPLLILLFVYAAISKLYAFTVFKQQLASHPFLTGVAPVLSFVLPAGELVAVLLLLFHRTYFRGLLFSLILLVIFTGYIGFILLHSWSNYPCSCGGIRGSMSWRTHLLFNAFFLCINLTLIYIYQKERRAVT